MRGVHMLGGLGAVRAPIRLDSLFSCLPWTDQAYPSLLGILHPTKSMDTLSDYPDLLQKQLCETDYSTSWPYTVLLTDFYNYSFTKFFE